jgi:predicted dehydrogenase
LSKKCMIIGLGQIGMGYDLELDSAKVVYTHTRAFSMHPAFELVGAVDPAETQRNLFHQHFGCPAYADIGRALQVQTPDVVVIASPTALHSTTLKEVLAHSSPIAILCEKPLAYNLAEAREMVEACDRAGVKLFVNYMRRADPGAIEIKRRIESGEITMPIKGVAWYSKGFLHNGSHFFNLLEFWLGAFVSSKMLDSGRLWEGQDPEPDVQVEFERGKVVFMAAWEEAFSHYTVELLSPAGRLRYEQGGESIAWQPIHADPKIAGYQVLQEMADMFANGMSRYQWHVADQLANALQNLPTTLCTGKQALKTLEAMHQIINQR